MRADKNAAYVFIDQYNNVHNANTRKELLDRLNAKSTSPIYRDINGKSIQTGYFIHGLWLERYSFNPITERESE